MTALHGRLTCDMSGSMRNIGILLCLLTAACGRGDIEGAVRETLRDPQAAQFRKIEVCPFDKDLWSGEVNAKNGFGAYNGFTPFFYDNGEVIAPDHSRFDGTAGRCFGAEALPWARQFAPS